jgi:HPt (histidine-containing phosphotransfer) domain-containing protein
MLGDAFPELIHSIFNDVDKILEKLSAWTDLTDIDGFALLPHSLKSSSAYIGAITLYELAHDCENVARQGKVAKALSYVDQINQVYEDVVEELAELGFKKPV